METTQIEENSEEFKEFDIDGQEEQPNFEQIERLMIDLEDPAKDECQKQAIQDQILPLLEQSSKIALAAYDAQYSAVEDLRL